MPITELKQELIKLLTKLKENVPPPEQEALAHNIDSVKQRDIPDTKKALQEACYLIMLVTGHNPALQEKGWVKEVLDKFAIETGLVHEFRGQRHKTQR